MIQKNTLTLAQQIQKQPETKQKTQQSWSLPYAQGQDIKNKNHHRNAKVSKKQNLGLSDSPNIQISRALVNL